MHIGSVGVFLLLSSQRLDLCKLSRRASSDVIRGSICCAYGAQASFGIWSDLSPIHSAGERLLMFLVV